ncbi:MAG TPA: response regulator transcription factor [Thermoanaerobaculia bacterium]|nr:response regulator transcription factor [Thermoanaerobaculia bacterium]
MASHGMKIIVADDHAIVRKGFHQIVSTRAGWQVAAEAANGDELLTHLRRDSYDLLVLDVSLGERSGIELLEHVRSEFPSLPVLMLSMLPEEQYAVRCLRAGASGYVQKDSQPEEILNAIARIAAGAKYITPRLASHLADEMVRGQDSPHQSLSTREFEVFRLIAVGRSATEIAEMLHLSVKTVSTYRTRIMEKTGFRSNADIIAYAIRNSLV